MSLATRLLSANPGAQVTTALTGALTTPGAKGAFSNFSESFESIATVTISSATSGNQVNTIAFNSIPQTFKHLQLRGIARDTWTASGVGEFYIYPNSSTGVYTDHWIFGDGGGNVPTASVLTARSDGAFMGAMIRGGVSSYPNTFASFVIDIVDYSESNKFKSLKSMAGSDYNGGGGAIFQTATLLQQAPITSLNITANGYGFARYSHFALYGIKG